MKYANPPLRGQFISLVSSLSKNQFNTPAMVQIGGLLCWNRVTLFSEYIILTEGVMTYSNTQNT